MNTFAQNFKVINALVPLADMGDGDPSSDVISMENIDHGVFILYTGANATGNSVITVESCDDTTPTTATEIAFRVTKYETSGSDVPSAVNAAVDSNGFTTSSTVANAYYVIEFDAADLYSTDKYVRLTLDEETNAAVVGGAIFIGMNTRYQADSTPTALT